MKKTCFFAALLVPSFALAGPFDGIYRLAEDANCALIGEEGGALRINEGIFYGVDVECRMTRPVNVIDMDATLYTMQCSGEDDIWAERAMLMDGADGGLIMVWDGYAFAYSRCEENEEEAALRAD